MNDQKLIARRLLDYDPMVFATTNKLKGRNNPMAWWTHRRGQDEIEEALAHRAADLLPRFPYAFVVACQFDQNRKAWKAWRAPYEIRAALGLPALTPGAIASQHLNRLAAVMRDLKLGSRNVNHRKAAANLKDGARHILETYAGRANLIWTTAKSLRALRENWMRIPGIGMGIANMAIGFNFRFGMVPQIASTAAMRRQMQVKPDTHVCHVLYRTGLAKERSESAAFAAAEQFSADCPFALDAGAFQIGSAYCRKRNPTCSECPLAFRPDGTRLCPRNRV